MNKSLIKIIIMNIFQKLQKLDLIEELNIPFISVHIWYDDFISIIFERIINTKKKINIPKWSINIFLMIIPSNISFNDSFAIHEIDIREWKAKLNYEYWRQMKLIILIIKIKMSPSVSNQGVTYWVAVVDPARQ